MDKYDLVLDIIEHPDNYTPEQLTEILSDPETREIYNLLCTTDSAIEAGNSIDVDAEWHQFTRMHTVRPRRPFMRFGSRAASIVAIICTSIVAVAAGIAVTITVTDYHKSEPEADSQTADATPYVATVPDTITTSPDSVGAAGITIMFEDEPLEAIMQTIADTYGLTVEFNNPETASLHLYYRLDPALPLDEVISQLNTFDQINIQRNDNTLIID